MDLDDYLDNPNAHPEPRDDSFMGRLTRSLKKCCNTTSAMAKNTFGEGGGAFGNSQSSSGLKNLGAKYSKTGAGGMQGQRVTKSRCPYCFAVVACDGVSELVHCHICDEYFE